MDWYTWVMWGLAKVWELLNSNFTAAFAGAGAAAWLARWTKMEDGHREELGKAKAAVQLAYSVCNGAIAMKKQQVRALKESYDQTRDMVHQHTAAKAGGLMPANAVLALALNMNMLDRLRVPIDRFESLVMGDLAVGRVPRPVMATRVRPMMVALRQSIDSVNLSVELHNKIIHETEGKPSEEKVPILFGVPRNGVIDDRFRSSVEQMYNGVDNCMWFGEQLMQDLWRYRVQLEKKPWLRRKRKLPGPSFDAETRALFPADDLFRDWIDNFKPSVGPTKGRRLRRVRYGIRKSWRRLWRKR